MNHFKSQRGALDILVAVLLLGLIGLAGFYFYSQHQTQLAANEASQANDQAKTIVKQVDPYKGWKTYTSTTEKATFKYPADWKLTEQKIPELNNADLATITSPSGQVKLEWTSQVDGLGGACSTDVKLGDDEGCPLTNILSSEKILSASGLHIKTGTLTRDGNKFTPWMAVQDEGQFALKDNSRVVHFEVYQAKNSGKDNTASFSLGGPVVVANQNLTKADAIGTFSKPEIQQAKLILASLSY